MATGDRVGGGLHDAEPVTVEEEDAVGDRAGRHHPERSRPGRAERQRHEHLSAEGGPEELRRPIGAAAVEQPGGDLGLDERRGAEMASVLLGHQREVEEGRGGLVGALRRACEGEPTDISRTPVSTRRAHSSASKPAGSAARTRSVGDSFA